jgi:uracil-DNA glycosylase family 4
MGGLRGLYERMKSCDACGLRAACTQVVPAMGQMDRPLLLIFGEAPGQQEDLEGEPFVGAAGQLLRQALRETKVINRTNTLVSNILRCRPPKNKFPVGDIPAICTAKWLDKEIELAAPDRMLLLGGKALKYVAGMDGITSCRGNWYDVRGIRTMATYHPSYVIRMDRTGDMATRALFERDVQEVAEELRQVLGEKRSTTPA